MPHRPTDNLPPEAVVKPNRTSVILSRLGDRDYNTFHCIKDSVSKTAAIRLLWSELFRNINRIEDRWDLRATEAVTIEEMTDSLECYGEDFTSIGGTRHE